MKLIAEEITQVDFLCEEKEGKKNYFIEGVFLQAEVENRNNRKYMLRTLQREVNKYSENYIQKGRALGELGHPDGPSINLDRVSHKIMSLTEDGNNFIGKAKILDTPMGNITKNLLDEGVMLGVSSRGMGSLIKKEGCSVVADDFMLATAADIVADPSAPDALLTVLWKEKNGFGITAFSKRLQLLKLKPKLIKQLLLTAGTKSFRVFPIS